MTVEEAGQVILENQPFYRCPHCSGRGEVKRGIIRATKPMEVDRDRWVQCGVCNGTTVLVKEEYAEACKLLDMLVPSPFKKIQADNEALKRLMNR